jgi:hypothetical protein
LEVGEDSAGGAEPEWISSVNEKIITCSETPKFEEILDIIVDQERGGRPRLSRGGMERRKMEGEGRRTEDEEGKSRKRRIMKEQGPRRSRRIKKGGELG